MIRRFASLAALALAAIGFALAAAPAAAQVREVEEVPEVWVHKHVGVHFPRMVGEFQRAAVTEYNEDGSDASAGYDLIRGGRKLASVTVYIYPPFPIGGCDAQYADVKRSVMQGGYENPILVEDERVPSPTGRNPGAAYMATFTFDAPFDGSKQHVRSQAYLFCPAGDKWLVAYRATWPADVDVSKEVNTLFRSFDWPAMLDR